jgi:hypothetical protein
MFVMKLLKRHKEAGENGVVGNFLTCKILLRGISEEEEMGGMWGTQAEVDKNVSRVILLI